MQHELQIRRKLLGIASDVIAAFIGIDDLSFGDIELYGGNDEAWISLTIIQLVRLCVLLDLEIGDFVPAAFQNTSAASLPARLPDGRGEPSVAATLRGILSERINDEQEVGWDSHALAEWLSDDISIGEMPAMALGDICKAIDVNTADVLMQYLRMFRKPE